MTLRLGRWQGGKAWLVEGHAERLPAPSKRGRFFDPCAGSCVVSLWALQQGYRVVIGDVNPRLVGCLRNLKADAEKVIVALDAELTAYVAASNHKADYAARRARLNAADPASVEASALFLFVLRVGFNGLYRESKRGTCNTPAGDVPPKKPFPPLPRLLKADDLRAIWKLLQRAEIRQGDFVETCADAKRGDVVFLDPPYAGTFTAYAKGGFAVEQRRRASAFLRHLDTRGVRFCVTDSAEHGALSDYGLWNVRTVQVRRSGSCTAEGRGMAGEIVVTNW